MTIYSNWFKDLATGIKFSGAGGAKPPHKPLLCAEWASRALIYIYGAALVALAMALVGCAPSHNWREVRHEGVPASAMLPCKPDRAVRDVAMLGPDTPSAPLHMMSCDVQGRTFAWAAWPIEDAQQGHAALQAWQRAGWASLRQDLEPQQEAPARWSVEPVSQAGALMAQRLKGPGINHQGLDIEAHWLMLYTPHWVMQFAVYGPAASPELIEPLWTHIQLSAKAHNSGL